MNEQWKQYLQTQGANFSANGDSIEHFDNRDDELSPLANNNIITAILDTTFINATGDDTKLFLQGQLTNDIGLIDPQHSQLSGYCNPKGRLLALFRISQHEQGYWLHLPSALLDKTLNRLKMFVMMAKVTLEAAPPGLVRIGIAGEYSERSLRKVFDTTPVEAGGVSHVGDQQSITIIRLPSAQPRFEIIAETAAMKKIWQTFSSDFTAVGSGAWQLLDIEAGQPSVTAETIEMFIPQMLNLDVIDGINFKKGCYPGQEVVARLHYRGKLKRHMHRVQFNANHCPPPGAPLYAANATINDETSTPQSIGTVVIAQPLSAGEFQALCVIANEHAVENGAWLLQGETKIVLKLHNLPYNLDPASDRADTPGALPSAGSVQDIDT